MCVVYPGAPVIRFGKASTASGVFCFAGLVSGRAGLGVPGPGSGISALWPRQFGAALLIAMQIILSPCRYSIRASWFFSELVLHCRMKPRP